MKKIVLLAFVAIILTACYGSVTKNDVQLICRGVVTEAHPNYIFSVCRTTSTGTDTVVYGAWEFYEELKKGDSVYVYSVLGAAGNGRNAQLVMGKPLDDKGIRAILDRYNMMD